MILLALLFALLLLLLLGPILPSISQTNRLPPSPVALPIIGHFHLLSALLHRSFHRLAARHGPLLSLRLGSAVWIVASTPDLAREFLKNNELCFTSHGTSAAISRLTYGYSSLAFTPYGPYWKFVKKLTMNELLSTRPLAEFGELRAREYRQFLRLLFRKAQSGAGEAVNLSAELPKMLNNMVVRMMLGSNSNTTPTSSDDDDGRAEEARIVLHQVTEIFMELNLADFFWFCRKLDLQGCQKRIDAIFRRFDALAEKFITEREQLVKRGKHVKKKGDNNNDNNDSSNSEEKAPFLDVLLGIMDHEDAGMNLTRDHIKALLLDLLTAGTDTTSTAIEWTLAELINHPKVLETAREEIDRVVGNTRLVRESDGPDLPYIQAIIKESLRLHPPTPLVSRKCVKDCEIGNYIIPANATVFINTWAMGRDPNNWESPLDFWPERFLQAHEGGKNDLQRDVRGGHFELLPFGFGRRMCPGMNLAIQILPTLVAAIIQCFDLKVKGSSSDRSDGDDAVLNMEERPGISAPRLHNLVCFPVARFSPLNIMDL
ncbi:Cytochrome P450, E-class, group I [Parasponia andersonii]|uniref:Cytochrome P450, E-class, group I n=1 Tax=Parasponia andersonii TaxID=3476 RepID=A0A2P5D1A1_PARAD|nr:Cytochrome P450, E-class, group I [Parasponia andersonii]